MGKAVFASVRWLLCSCTWESYREDIIMGWLNTSKTVHFAYLTRISFLSEGLGESANVEAGSGRMSLRLKDALQILAQNPSSLQQNVWLLNTIQEKKLRIKF